MKGKKYSALKEQCCHAKNFLKLEKEGSSKRVADADDTSLPCVRTALISTTEKALKLGSERNLVSKDLEDQKQISDDLKVSLRSVGIEVESLNETAREATNDYMIQQHNLNNTESVEVHKKG